MSEKKVGAGVGVIILRNNKILLGKRHVDPEKASSLLKGAGTWTMPGGSLEFGETFEQAAIRETLEETGLIVKKVRTITVQNDRIQTAHFVTIGLIAEEFEGEPQVMEPEVITEWHWFDLNQLPSPLFFASAKILEKYKRQVFYIQEP